MNIVLILLGTVLSAVLYRMYGCGDKDFKLEYSWTGAVGRFIRKIPKFRALLCNLIALSVLAVVYPVSAPWWMWLLCWALGFLTLLTYHDTKPWNPMKPRDNFWLHGFCNGLAFMPLAFYAPELLGMLAVRSIIMCVFMGVWCHWIFTSAIMEEHGRGGIMVFTLLLLLIKITG